MKVIALILHMNISCDKVFQYILIFLTLWPWPWRLAYFVKTWTFLITFQQRVFIFHLNISCGKIFLLLLDLLTMTFHIEKKTPIIHNKIIDIRAFILHMSIFLWQDLPTCIKVFVLVTLAIFGIDHNRGYLWFTNTSCLMFRAVTDLIAVRTLLQENHRLCLLDRVTHLQYRLSMYPYMYKHI